MSLYTGKGDKGDTSFFGSTRRFSKHSLRVEALGGLDEVNSLLGLCKVKAETGKMRSVAEVLEGVQNDLFIIQAEVASYYAPKGTPVKRLSKKNIEAMESVIKGIEDRLDPIRSFTIAGGTELAALLDYARAVARRIERVAVALNSKEKVSAESLRYLNRLSSLLFALARFSNKKRGIKEKSPRY
ncbi:MAG TPA: cob(I)yrinic acid a,c-diamide adenosyltransferase [Candidatus Paceibacterota bacterium]